MRIFISVLHLLQQSKNTKTKKLFLIDLKHTFQVVQYKWRNLEYVEGIKRKVQTEAIHKFAEQATNKKGTKLIKQQLHNKH